MLRTNFSLRYLFLAKSRLSGLINNGRHHSLWLRNRDHEVRRLPSRFRQQYFASLAHNYDKGTPETEEMVDSVHVESIDEELGRIDRNAKSTGRVLRKHVESVYNSIKSLGKASSMQSLYLLRCCGFLMRAESPIKRTELADEIWNTVQELKIPVDASHYNALMKVYLENDHEFSAIDFLSKMERDGIEPNRVTYQHIIEKYCRDGDLNGASTILEHMKEKGIAVTEAVFNSLVKGHTKIGDFQGARHILNVMRNANLTPTATTYTVLARGFAEKGDIEEIVSTLNKAEELGAYLTDKDYLSVVYELIVSGNQDKIDQVMKYIPDMMRSKWDLAYLLQDVLNIGLHKEGFDFCRKICSHIDFYIGICSYIQCSFSADKPLEEIIEHCKVFATLGYPNAYLYAAKCALQHGKNTYAVELFKSCQKEGIPVRCHYFWPMIVNHGNEGNETGIFSTLKVIADMGILADFDTYYTYVFPRIAIDDTEAVIKNLRETGHSSVYPISALFKCYCDSGSFKKALYLFENFNIDINVKAFLDCLLRGFDPSIDEDVEFLKLLKCCEELFRTHDKYHHKEDFFGSALLQLHDSQKLSNRLLREAYKMNIELSFSGCNALCDRCGRGNPEAVQIIRSMQYGAPLPGRTPFRYAHPRDTDLETLEKHLVELQAAGMTTRVVLRHLLMEYCRQKNFDKMLAVKEELDNQGFVYTPPLYAMMIDTFVAFNDLSQAEALVNKFTEEYPDIKLNDIKGINYATLLVKCKKSKEALEFLNDHCGDINSPHRGILFKSVKKLLSEAADTGDVQLTKELVHIFVSKLQHYSTQNLLDPLVKVHLVRNDMESATEEFSRCLQQYGYAPYRNMMFKTCIAAKDFVRLQHVVDLTAAVNGKTSTLHELAFCFIECGQVQQAEKVFETLGIKAEFSYLEELAFRLLRDNKVTEMENFVSATKVLTRINRDNFYYNLLRLYSQNNNCAKALELWNCMQEENVQPSIETLQMLANLLEKNNQPVPFVVPGVSIDMDNAADANAASSDSYKSTLVSDLKQCLDSGDCGDTLDILNRMKKGHIRLLSTQTVRNLIDMFLANDRLADLSNNVQFMSFALEKSRSIFKPLLEQYAERGDVMAAKQIMKFLPDFTLKNISFNLYFNKAHLASGQYEELLSALENNIRVFSTYGFVQLLNAAPHFEDRAVKLIDVYSTREGMDAPKRALWIHYFTHERYEEAEAIFKQYSALFTGMDLLASQMLRAIRFGGNENVARKFIDFLHNHGMKQLIEDRVYSCLLDILVGKNDHQGAVKLLEETKGKKIPTTTFRRSTLLALKELLEENNKPVPFETPEKDDDVDTSSSDSE